MRLHPTWLILAGVACSPLLASCSSSSPPALDNGAAGSGASSGAGAAGASGSGTAGISGSAGSSSGAGGSAGNSAGASGSGATSGTGTGGASGSGTGGVSGSGATSGAGAAGVAGGTAGSAGSAGSAGTAGASGCAATDQNGKANWTAGAMTGATQDYLRSCDIRLINNNWGAAALGCVGSTSNYSVHVNADGSFGWNFQRGSCGKTDTTKPDFPEVEFGVHPFGAGNSLATTPDFSSTTLLPLQIKDINTASVKINSLNISLQQSGSWDISFELWLSTGDPRQANPGVYAEFMTWWGWQTPRWPESCGTNMMSLCAPTGVRQFLPAGQNITSGSKTYKLEVQDDQWATNQWRYFQYRDTAGPQTSFNGTVDVKPLLNYLVNRGYSSNLWVTRFEVGSEIDDMTQGSVNMKGITFEVNGQSRTAGSP